MPYRAYQIDCGEIGLGPNFIFETIVEVELEELTNKKVVYDNSLIFQSAYKKGEKHLFKNLERAFDVFELKWRRQP